MHRFSVGDTVRLKSGGPTMTMIELGEIDDPNPYVHCSWFKSSNEVTSQGFPVAALELATAR